MKQSLLDFKTEQDYNNKDFIVSLSNLEAYKAITEQIKWLNNQLLLIGEEGSGKTHLCKIWQNSVNAVILKPNEDFIKYQETYSAYIYEDIENVASEEYLFHLINFCRNNSFQLLLTTSQLPDFLLNDLKSRINSMHKVLIKKPDDEMVKILLVKHFTDKQLKIPADVLEYTINRIERSFKSIKLFVNAVDRLSMVEKRNITVPMVKKVIEHEFLQEEFVTAE